MRTFKTTILGLVIAGCGMNPLHVGQLGRTQLNKRSLGAAGELGGAINSEDGTVATTSATAIGLSYEHDIKPIMARACVSCHDGAAKNAVILDAFEALAKEGTVLDKWTKVLQFAQVGTMPPPPAEKLSDADLKTISDWIAAGADGASSSFQTALTCNADHAPAAAKTRRLTNYELQNTLAQLLPAALGAALTQSLALLPGDTTPGSFDVLTTSLTSNFIDAMYGVSKAVGDGIAKDAATRTALASCWSETAAVAANMVCVQQFLPTFAEAVYRRSLSADEITALSGALTADLTTLTPAQALASGVQALLFSPNFYLLPELDGKDTGNPYRVGDFAVASRLSYGLTGSAPDAPLFAAAKDGSLAQAEVLKAQAARLLLSPAFSKHLDHFTTQWLKLDSVTAPAQDRTMDQVQAIVASLRNDVLATVRQVLLTNNGSFADLFDTDIAYIDSPDLAQIYGLSDTAASLPKFVSLDKGTRAGLLTRAGMLSYDATPILTTIRRGRFIRQYLLGQPIANPPANVMLNPPDGTQHVSLRDRLTASTTSYTCTFCHSKLNPFGFVLGNFASDGSYQTTEVDALSDGGTTTTTIDASVDAALDVKGRDQAKSGSELSGLVGQSKDARLTFAKIWYSAMGAVPVSAQNGCVPDEMFQIVDSGAPVLDMIKAFVSAPEFLLRAY